MKLRELLKCCSLDVAYRKLYRMHHGNEKLVNPVELAKLSRAYGNVVHKLLKLPKTKPVYPVAIRRVHYPPDEQGKRSAYYTCSFFNPNYTPPPRGRKPWHGKSDDKDDHLKGCYNASYNGHQKYFGMDFAPWEDLVDAEVLCPKTIAAATAVAIVLWEITFFGFDNEKAISEMTKLANKAMEEMARGECVAMDVCLKNPDTDWETPRKPPVEDERREAGAQRQARPRSVLPKRKR